MRMPTRRWTRRFALLITATIVAQHAAAAQQPDSLANAPVAPSCRLCVTGPSDIARGVQDTTGRRKAIVYSDAYGTRLTIHRIGSYVELPLFAAEYIVGTRVLNDEQANPGVRSSLKGTHTLIATGLEALFAVNTVTGVWNLIESRHDPAGRTRRWVHSILMLAVDGGFAATASSAGSARGGGSSADTHRSLAIASMGVATAATVMMWLWKD